MVNFRYHLVSLIAVFLALGIGVVLGAGPLQNAINQGGESLSAGSEKERELQDLLTDMQVRQEEYGQYLLALGDEVLPGTLEGREVTLIVLPQVTGQQTNALTEALETAGATVNGLVELSDSWISAEAATYRDTLAGPVSSHLEGEPTDTSAPGILGAGLVEALTLEGPEVDLVKEMLTDEEASLVVSSSLPSKPSTDLILVGPPQAGETGDLQGGAQSEGEEVDPSTVKAWLGLGSALADFEGGRVVVGSAADEGTLVAVIRHDGLAVATVDLVGTQMATLNATFALADGGDGAYGLQEGAKTPIAPLP